MGEMELPEGHNFVYNAVASSQAEMLFNYSGKFGTYRLDGKMETLFDAGIHAQTNRPRFYTALTSRMGIFGVRLYPHTMPFLFDIPAQELTNQTIDLFSLLGADGEELMQLVFAARGIEEKVAVVSHFLLRRIRQRAQHHAGIAAAIFRIHQSKGQVALSDLLDASCLSQRQFERNFKELAGFAPKAYLRIVRFESVIYTYREEQPLTELALDNGYFDQAHFNHDFKQFAGQTPSVYFKSLSELPLVS